MTAGNLNRIFSVKKKKKNIQCRFPASILVNGLSTSLVQLTSLQITSSPALVQAAHTQHLVQSSHRLCKVSVISTYKKSVESACCVLGSLLGPIVEEVQVV